MKPEDKKFFRTRIIEILIFISFITIPLGAIIFIGVPILLLAKVLDKRWNTDVNFILIAMNIAGTLILLMGGLFLFAGPSILDTMGFLGIGLGAALIILSPVMYRIQVYKKHTRFSSVIIAVALILLASAATFLFLLSNLRALYNIYG